MHSEMCLQLYGALVWECAVDKVLLLGEMRYTRIDNDLLVFMLVMSRFYYYEVFYMIFG